MKKGKDRLFIIVLAIVIANISYHLLGTMMVITSGWWTSRWLWFLIVADSIAIAGALWLLRNYRQRRRLEREKEAQASELGTS